jgi:DNA-binding response OmpR family regulator
MSPLIPDAPRKILVIDDCEFQRCRVVDLLMDLPYAVTLAHDGVDGYQLAIADRPDLILLDVNMPGMDGYACCRLLKAHPVTHSIPVIFLSGTQDCEDRIHGLSIGGADFVTKPYHDGELVARIRVHLDLVQRQGSAPQPALSCAQAMVDQNDVLVAAATRLIEDHLGEALALSDIARRVGTYREKLSDIFRAKTGKTVFAYIRERRLERSALLLKETGMDVQAIATHMGFSSAANFSTAFREHKGVTPSAYRQAPL